MPRALTFAALLAVVPCTLAGQQPSVLRVTVTLVNAAGTPMPVPQHVLFVSDDPVTAAPRRMITGSDGTASLTLPPGKYTVESDQPVAFENHAYEWIQTVDVTAGRETTLELTTHNAEVGPITPAAAESLPGAVEPPPAAAASSLLLKWQDSVVALWTPTTHASGFAIDARGLIATSARAIGAATSIEVQLTPDVKVAARVLETDRARDVAILRIDPAVLASVPPVPLGCGLPRKPLEDGQDVFTIGTPLGEAKGLTDGTVNRAAPPNVESDFLLPSGSVGGPVFVDDGDLVGITSLAGDNENRSGDVRIVPLDAVCDVVASAEPRMTDAAPSGTHLPVEPARPFPMPALATDVARQPASLHPYQTSSSDFDITFITPPLVYGASRESDRTLTDFGDWSDYVAGHPAVLLVRATPKLTESFWTTLARGAAATQGISLPPIKHFKPGFSRMRAFCGDTEVTPIHPFTLETRVSESDAIREGLYVFAPDALGPTCGKVKLVLYSEKDPDKGDERTVDSKLLDQVWQDFAPYRALK